MASRIILPLLLLAGGAIAQDVGTVPSTEPPVFVLKGGTVVTGAGETLSDATVVIRDGLIEAVGVGVEVPAEAWKLDTSGMYVYPGLIDALAASGFSGTGQQEQSRGSRAPSGRGAGQQSEEEGTGYFAHVRAADHIVADDKSLAAWREVGVLSLNVTPDQGIFRGVTSLINLNGRSPDEMTVSAATGMSMSFQGQGFSSYPGSLMGVIAHIRQTLYDARHNRQAWEVYGEDPKGLSRPETDRTLEALQPVVSGDLPLFFPARLEREIYRVLSLCEETETACVVSGGAELDRAAGPLQEKGIAVLVSLNYPVKPTDVHPEAEEDLSSLRNRAEAPRVAARLHEAGVRFAFWSDGARPQDFLKNLRLAVREGLPPQAAIRAATLTPAELLGVARQLGSLEMGKIANLIVTDKDLFEEDAQVKHVFVDGEHWEIPARKKNESGGRGGPAQQISGAWDVQVSSPGQSYSMRFDLAQSGENLTGAVSSELGSSQIRDGSYSGGRFAFKIDVDFGMGAMVVDFAGDVTEDRLTGTTTVGTMGTFPMEGRKVPQGGI